ncbi:hypothetical protein K2X30_05380 [bacterium]|nr:hypothetical protein [bacterium]
MKPWGIFFIALIFFQANSGNAVEQSIKPESVFKVRALTGFIDAPHRVFSTHWVDLKIRPFLERHGWKAIQAQVGFQQSQDNTYATYCRIRNRLLGMVTCPFDEVQNTIRFLAIYTGIQTEIVELLAQEPRPMQIFIGSGAAVIHSLIVATTTIPYASLEASYRWRERFVSRAGIYVSLSSNPELAGIAAPQLSLDYLF